MCTARNVDQANQADQADRPTAKTISSPIDTVGIRDVNVWSGPGSAGLSALHMRAGASLGGLRKYHGPGPARETDVLLLASAPLECEP